MIIAISGKAGSGKDTIGSMLAYFIATGNDCFSDYIKFNNKDYWYKLANWDHKYFALPLKDSISKILNCSIEDLNNNNYKQSTIDWLDGMSVRSLLQKFGTGIRNGVHPNFWVNLLFKTYNKNNWIITDVRFKSEINKIKEYDCVLIRINRNSSGAGNHISETELDDYKFFDYVISNNETIEDLFYKIYYLYKELLKEELI